MNSVFILWHTHVHQTGNEDEKLLGVYDSRAEADSALLRFSKIEGFSRHPKGCEISGYKLNRDHWCDGFITSEPNDPREPTA